MSNEKKYMAMAIKLAQKGAGFVSPNPMVGCVVTSGGRVVSVGYHKKYGVDHAEIDALRKIINHKSKIINDLTVYVNLEPCAHFGKTPPCVDALIEAGVRRVVIGMKDPNPKTAGKSIRKLRRAGIKVEVGVLRKECEELNEIFTHWITTGRPFVLLKTAITLDGALAFKKGVRSNFSSTESYKLVHKLRQIYDAIGIGVNTAIIDNPRLTSRGAGKRSHPTRVVFDTNFRVPEKLKMFNGPGNNIIFVGPDFSKVKKERLEKKFSAVTIVPMPLGAGKKVSIEKGLNWLGKNGFASIMIEGGAEIANRFLDEKLADKIMLTVAPVLSTEPMSPKLNLHLLSPYLNNPKWRILGRDLWLTAYLDN